MATEKEIQLKSRNFEELLFPITKSELVRFADGTTLDEKMGNVSISGAIVITAPVISFEGASNKKIGVTVDGELTTEETSEESTGDLVLKTAEGKFYKVLVSEDGELETELLADFNEEGELQKIYLQTPEPHGLVFKLGVLEDGTLLTSPICDIDLIMDNNVSATRTWSSNKILSVINSLEFDSSNIDTSNLVTKDEFTAENLKMNDGTSIETNIQLLQEELGLNKATLEANINAIREVL